MKSKDNHTCTEGKEWFSSVHFIVITMVFSTFLERAEPLIERITSYKEQKSYAAQMIISPEK